MTWRSFVEIGANGGLDAIVPTGETSVAVAVTAIVGTFASGGTQAQNWTRFARSPTQGFVGCLVAFFVGELLMIFFGGIGALAFGIGGVVIGGVVIGTLLALPIYNNLIGYLAWLGILIPPIGGVIIGDWFVHWRRGMPEPLAHDFPAFRWANLAVYGVATFAAWLSSVNGWFIPPVNGIALAIVGILAVSRLAPADAGSARTAT